MGQLKLRLQFLEVDAQRMSAPPALPTNEALLLYERVCLQLRKVLELIAFAALVANQESFAALHPKFADFQRAKNVLVKLKEINPRYYPVAARQATDKGGNHIVDAVPDTWLSEEEFAPLFDACSQVLHVANPFDKRETTELGRTVPEWIERIRGLLQIHVVALTADDIIVVFMHDWSTTEVQLLSAAST